MDVSENSGTPKSSILIGFSIKDHPFWGTFLGTLIYDTFFLHIYHVNQSEVGKYTSHTVDGSEIRLSPAEVGSIIPILYRGFVKVISRISEPSTVWESYA